jgi:flagellar biosynthesis protein FlhG
MIVNGFDGDALGEVRAACACLFSRAAAESGNFITSLDLDMVKKAYRRNARLHHPDMDRQRVVNNVTSDHFLAIQHSYETLTNYLEARSPSSDPSPPRGKIIAVGGAKGGIGKSVITANLGIHLSSLGFRTVLVDLDLGGSNLHLYLGHRAILQNTINDFLRKRVASLDEVMVKSDHGPLLIGGDSSELGSANIDFMKKTKLVKAIHAIDADLVILDLGGDTSFNILDFFLQADYSIVVTTRDSASYIGAYHFLKAALYRKLNRLSGRESRSGEEKNADLERFIREATMSDDGQSARTINELLAVIRENHPEYLPAVMKAVNGFNPYLIVNRFPLGINPEEVAGKIQHVTKRWLTRDVTFLGGIARHPDVERSAIDLVPAVTRYPKGAFAGEIAAIAKRLLTTSAHS